MKIGIIYLTGTGSTGIFGSEIAQGFNDLGHNIVIGRFDKMQQEQWLDCDILGFGSPTFSYQAPRFFLRYLKSLPPLNKPYFLFCTCGGQPGNTFWSMYKILKKKQGIFLDSIVGKGPNNIRAWRPKLSYTLPPQYDGLTSYDLAAARDFSTIIIKKFESVIVNHTQSPKKEYPNLICSILTPLISQRWQMAMVEGIKHVDLEKCTACGICANKICPSGAITLDSQNHPIFNQNICIGCSGCVNLCPTLAIWTKNGINKHPYTLYAKYVLNPPH